MNCSETDQNPAQLFQFGLAAEDEASRSLAPRRADGLHRAAAMVPVANGVSVYKAFRQDWEANGGTVVGVEHVDQPVALAQQIADLFQLRKSEGRAKSLQNRRHRRRRTTFAPPGHRVHLPGRHPQLAQQIKPTLNFQYAGDVPVYATSTCSAPAATKNQYLDMTNVMFCETPGCSTPPTRCATRLPHNGPKPMAALAACTRWASMPTAWRHAWANSRHCRTHALTASRQPGHERQPAR